MLKKVKDIMYQTVVEKDADELVKHLGNKEAILSYVEKNKIPERKSTYEMLYETLLEKLDDEQAEKLYTKKFHFVERRKLSVLWEEFEDVKKEERTREELEKVKRKLAKIHQLQSSLLTKEETLKEKQVALQKELGITPTECVQQPEKEIKKETKLQEKVQPTQEDAVNALFNEAQSFGETPIIDPNLREEPPTNVDNVEDEIYKGF